MGKYWRSFKSKVRKQIRIQTASSVNRTRTIALLRPKNVNSEEAWKKFVEDTLSNDFQVSSIFILRLKFISVLLLNFCVFLIGKKCQVQQNEK
jgi:hypothetical protein